MKKVIDSHIHLWDLKNNYNQWVYSSNKYHYLQKNYMLDSLEKSLSHQLSGIVHIEAHNSDVNTLNEAKWLISQQKKHPNIALRIIAFADILQHPEDFEKDIKSLLAYPEIIGIRHILAYHPDAYYSPVDKDHSNHPNLIKNLSVLKKYNLIFDAQLYPKQWLNLLEHVDLVENKIALEHFALPLMHNSQEKKLWQKAVQSLSHMNNAYLKLSGLNMLHVELKLETVLQLLSFCLNELGAKKLIYGSNFPVEHHDNYSYWFDLLYSLIQSDSDREDIFFHNAHKLYCFNH
ncbi:amidohydrolase family protein [Thiotrichales bacterium 19S11-10]|nr:amidohydrolase family protein [Thiotrichales bacterium 19S11-10]